MKIHDIHFAWNSRSDIIYGIENKVRTECPVCLFQYPRITVNDEIISVERLP